LKKIDKKRKMHLSGDFGPKRPGIPEQKDQTFRCMKTKFSGPKRPTYPHFQALAV
jgi:hypothetical protein